MYLLWTALLMLVMASPAWALSLTHYVALRDKGACTMQAHDKQAVTLSCKVFDAETGDQARLDTVTVTVQDIQSRILEHQQAIAALQALQVDATPLLALASETITP